MKIGEKSIGIFIVSLRENLIDMDEFNKETIFEIQNTRVHTGIPRLDELISGGLPQNSIILV